MPRRTGRCPSGAVPGRSSRCYFPGRPVAASSPGLRAGGKNGGRCRAMIVCLARGDRSQSGPVAITASILEISNLVQPECLRCEAEVKTASAACAGCRAEQSRQHLDIAPGVPDAQHAVFRTPPQPKQCGIADMRQTSGQAGAKVATFWPSARCTGTSWIIVEVTPERRRLKFGAMISTSLMSSTLRALVHLQRRASNMTRKGRCSPLKLLHDSLNRFRI